MAKSWSGLTRSQILFYQFEEWDLRDIRQATSYNLCSDMRCNLLEFAAILSHLDVIFPHLLIALP